MLQDVEIGNESRYQPLIQLEAFPSGAIKQPTA